MDAERKYWFAMRATFNRNVQVRELLSALFIDTFIPMKTVKRKMGGHYKLERIPVIRNLIFVHTERNVIQQAKADIPYLQYIVSRATHEIIVVPDAQMEDFIAVSGTCDERLRYYAEGELNLALGSRVRITSGEFAGIEGVLMRVQGARDKRVVVSVDGIMSVSLMSLSPAQIEKI